MIDAKTPTLVITPLAVDEHQAAAMLGISVRTFWDYRHSGEIPTIRIGRLVRFAVDDLKRFVDSRRESSRFDPNADLESSG